MPDASSVLNRMSAALTLGDLWSDSFFGCTLPAGAKTLKAPICRKVLDALDVGKTLRRRRGVLSSYETSLQDTWIKDEPVLPLGLWVLWGDAESGKSEVLNRISAAIKGDARAAKDGAVYDVGDVNSEHAAPIGNAEAFTKFLSDIETMAQATPDAKVVLVDSISWYDDIDAIANAAARKNGVPKQWEEYLKAFHRWAVKTNIILIATMNPNDTWEGGIPAQVQAFESSVGVFCRMATGELTIRYAKQDNQEPRLHTEFDIAWRRAHPNATSTSAAAEGIIHDFVTGVPMEPAIPTSF